MFKISYLLVLALWWPTMSQALVDPTQPEGYKKERKQTILRVESILFSAARKVAVINGKVVSEGDRVDQAKIISISKDSVKVSSDGKYSILKLNRTSIRQEK